MANAFSSNLKNNLIFVDKDMGIKLDTLKDEIENLKENEFDESDKTEQRLDE